MAFGQKRNHTSYTWGDAPGYDEERPSAKVRESLTFRSALLPDRIKSQVRCAQRIDAADFLRQPILGLTSQKATCLNDGHQVRVAGRIGGPVSASQGTTFVRSATAP